jgi:hypothetical protein
MEITGAGGGVGRLALRVDRTTLGGTFCDRFICWDAFFGMALRWGT